MTDNLMIRNGCRLSPLALQSDMASTLANLIIPQLRQYFDYLLAGQQRKLRHTLNTYGVQAYLLRMIGFDDFLILLFFHKEMDDFADIRQRLVKRFSLRITALQQGAFHGIQALFIALYIERQFGLFHMHILP